MKHIFNKNHLRVSQFCFLVISTFLSSIFQESVVSSNAAAEPAQRIVQIATRHYGDDRFCILYSTNVTKCSSNHPEWNFADTSDAKQISLGNTFGCTLSTRGVVACRGKLTAGEDTIEQIQPSPPITDGIQLVSGSIGTCVLHTGNTVSCWGSWRVNPGSLLNGVSVKNLYQGGDTFCAMSISDRLYCWGHRFDLGLSNSFTGVKEISVGYDSLCGINSIDEVFCRGSIDPPPENIGKVVQLSVSYYHACALTIDDAVVCWGSKNAYGDQPIKSVPADFAGKVTAVVTNADYDCVVVSDTALYCWYIKKYGIVSLENWLMPNVPTSLIVAIVGSPTVGSLMTVAGVKTDSRTHPDNRYQYEWFGLSFGKYRNSWYRVDEDEIGRPIWVTVTVKREGYAPVSITSNPLNVAGFKVTAGTSNSCTKIWVNRYLSDAYRDLRCWGEHSFGQLDIPLDISGISGSFQDYSVGDGNICAIVRDELLCWGQDKVSTKWQWGSHENFENVMTGKNYTCMSYKWRWGIALYCIDNEGEIKNFKYDISDVAGLGETGALSCSLWYGQSFKEFAGVSSWHCLGSPSLEGGTFDHMVVSGESHACTIKDDLSVFCWGSNDAGQIDVPSGLNNVQSLSAGGSHSCAVTNEAYAVCWGSNNFGESDVPNNLGKVAQIAAGGEHTCAVKVDSRIVCWGNPVATTVADLNAVTTPKSSPVELVQLDNHLMEIGVSPSVKKSDGDLSWVVRARGSNKIFCKFTSPRRYCQISAAVGRQYDLEVVTRNQVGESVEALSPFKFCPLEPAKIDAHFTKTSVTTGQSARLSGRVSNLCQKMPNFISARTKPYGGAWSGWTQIPLDPTGSFSSNFKVDVNTQVELRTPLQTGYLYKKGLVIGSSLKTVLPLGFDWSSNKVQGFNQGGVINVKFSGDKSFNGLCTIAATNNNAFNFALTYVGSEQRFNVFKVKNGIGYGQVKMRWNGKVVVSASCVDPHYVTISDLRTPTFRASF